MDRDELKPYQQRVVDEAMALLGNVDRLSAFIASNRIFGQLPTAEQEDMREQLYFMRCYAAALQRRIDRFAA